MKARSNSGKNAPAVRAAGEVRLKARAVSRGVAVGRAVCLYGSTRQFYRIGLDSDDAAAAEIKRLRAAFRAARKQLTGIVSRKSGRIAESGPGIFESHLAIVDDPTLRTKIEDQITGQRVNAEWAIKLVTDDHIAKYKAIEDEHLRDRYIDIEDVSDRLLTALGAHPQSEPPFLKDSVIIARELKPSTVVELADTEPVAFVTENGGWTSHSFILAREMKRPAVTGVKKVLRRMKTGDVVVVDGFNGQVIVNPSEETLSRYTVEAARDIRRDSRKDASSTAAPRTLDGREIRIYANSDSPAAYLKAAELGARGVGLYRSEFLFNRFRGFPSENEQAEAYGRIADAAGGLGVKIRTFDLEAEELVDQNAAREKNPALGMRAIRLGFNYKKLLRTQLRALLQASHGRKIDIVLPMVSGLSEIRTVRRMLRDEAAKLKAKGKRIGEPRIGAMIEVPSAVVMIDELAAEADFLCLGTNDLIQYLLAADRDNEAVAGWYRTLHPAVLRAVRAVLDAGARAGIQTIVCGEMAGSPYYAPLLVGLGATDLSINAASIKRVRTIVSGIAYEEAQRLVESVAGLRTVEEVEYSIDKQIRKSWLHLFPADFSFD